MTEIWASAANGGSMPMPVNIAVAVSDDAAAIAGTPIIAVTITAQTAVQPRMRRQETRLALIG